MKNKSRKPANPVLRTARYECRGLEYCTVEKIGSPYRSGSEEADACLWYIQVRDGILT